MGAHLLGLCGFVFPFGNVLGPLVIWLMKRDEMPFVGDQAKESLNFQISMTLAAIALFLLGLLTCGIGLILLPLLGLAGVVFPVIAAIKTNDGIAYRYPFTIRPKRLPASRRNVLRAAACVLCLRVRHRWLSHWVPPLPVV